MGVTPPPREVEAGGLAAVRERLLLASQNSCSPPGICHPGGTLASHWLLPVPPCLLVLLLSRFLWPPLSSPPCVCRTLASSSKWLGSEQQLLSGSLDFCLISPPQGLRTEG